MAADGAVNAQQYLDHRPLNPLPSSPPAYCHELMAGALNDRRWNPADTVGAGQIHADRLAQHAQSVGGAIPQAHEAGNPGLLGFSGTKPSAVRLRELATDRAVDPDAAAPKCQRLQNAVRSPAGGRGLPQQALLQHAQGVWSQVQQHRSRCNKRCSSRAGSQRKWPTPPDRLQQHHRPAPDRPLVRAVEQPLRARAPAATNPTAPDQTTTPPDVPRADARARIRLARAAPAP